MSEDFEIVLNDAFDQYGHPTPIGKNAIIPFTITMEKIFSSSFVKDMTIEETKNLCADLNYILEKMLSQRVNGKERIVAKFLEMSDEQFMAYLKVKYGKEWALKTLSKEECDRLPEYKLDCIVEYKDYSEGKYNVTSSKILGK